jgi:hypothetical protein
VSALIIAGFHRSGTSLLTQVLDKAGLFIGDDLLDANPHNPKGHFEDVEVIRLHDRLLAAGGRTWQVTEGFIPHIPRHHWAAFEAFVTSRNRDHRLWGFKDPRVCHFLSLWKHLVPDAKIVMVFRHPASCVHSLERRHAWNLLSGRGPTSRHWRFWMEPDHAARMWIAANKALIRAYRAYPEDVMPVFFEDLAGNLNIVRAINERWDLGLTEVPPSAAFDERLITAAAPTAWATDPEVRSAADTIMETLETIRIEAPLEVS